VTGETPRAVAVSFVRVAWVAEDTAVSVRITGGRFVLTTIVNGEVTHERDLSVEDPVALADRAHEVWGKGGEDYAEGVEHIAEALRALSNAWDAGADGTNNPPWLSTRP
jgi:hypothetical protein